MQAGRNGKRAEFSLTKVRLASPTGRHRQASFFAQRRPKRRGSQPTDAGRSLGGIALADERTVETARGAHRF
jgi:hypothetical protein